jgi:retron-type reverse transcriptase
MDLEKFFDRMNHDILTGKLAKRIGDKRVLRVIRRYLQAWIMVNGVVQERWEWTPRADLYHRCSVISFSMNWTRSWSGEEGVGSADTQMMRTCT